MNIATPAAPQTTPIRASDDQRLRTKSLPSRIVLKRIIRPTYEASGNGPRGFQVR